MMSETELDPPEQFLAAVQRGEYAGEAAALVESFNRWTPLPNFGHVKHPELTAALQRAERAGFLRGLGVAARICRAQTGERQRRACCWSTCEELEKSIEACDGREGEAVREHCAQFAWSGEGEGDAG